MGVPRTIVPVAVFAAAAIAMIAGLGSGGARSAGVPSSTTAPPVSNVPAATTTTSAPRPESTTTTQARSTTLIPIPAGCDTPAPAQVVFVGQLVAVGATDGMARYELRQIRAGATGGRERQNLLDVAYGDDIRFLTVGNQYLVGAALGGESGTTFRSKVREEAPLFGGNDVLDVGQTDVDCPTLEDPVRTLSVTGRDVETGVLSPLRRSPNRLLRAILIPAGIGVGAIVALAALRWILTGAVRGAGAAVGAGRETTRQHRWR